MGMWADEGALRELYGLWAALNSSPGVFGADVGSVKLVLFKSTFTEARTNTMASMAASLADFVGYAPVNCAGNFPFLPAIVAGEPRIVGSTISFAKTVGNPDQTIYGWGIITLTGGGANQTLLVAKLFSAPRTLTDAANTLSFVPYIGAYGI